MFPRSLMAFTFLVTLTLPLTAQDRVQDDTEAAIDTRYAPSPAFPFGRPNPDAPAQLADFAFMIGEFDCVDEIRQPDGSRLRFRAVWNAHYFLNGYGIQDEYWTPRFFTSNIRIFDPAAGQWRVTYFKMPGYSSGRYEGGQEGDAIVLRAPGSSGSSGLTFHNISDEGFDWHSGGPDPNWTSSCTRRR